MEEHSNEKPSSGRKSPDIPETPNPPQVMDPNSARERKRKKAPVEGEKKQKQPRKKET